MMSNNTLVLSALPHTWVLDLDGSILMHNGYKNVGRDSFVPGAEEFLNTLPTDDFVIFVTSRKKKYQKITEDFLKQNGIRYNAIIYEVPYGERILINDSKPSGLKMAYACPIPRDVFDIKVIIDEKL